MAGPVNPPFADPVMQLAVQGSVLLCAFHQPAAPIHFHHLHEAAALLASRCPEGMGMIVLLCGGAGQPESGSREVAVDMLKRLDTRLLSATVMIQTPGMGGTLLRSLISTLLLVARRRNVQIVANLDAAVQGLIATMQEAKGKPPPMLSLLQTGRALMAPFKAPA